MTKLTATAVKAALAKPGTYQDGDGLFLKVDKRGGASWKLRLQRNGKRTDYGLGSARLLTLAQARDKAGELRKAIKVERRGVLAERKGDVPVGGIVAADIIGVLNPIWQDIPETARQVRNRICAVLDYAHANGR